MVNDEAMVARAEVVREKGTDRKAFFSGQVDKYTWRDMGSSYLMSELQAAYLLAQLESAEEINNKRVAIWREYNNHLSAQLRAEDILNIPAYNEHNAHLYYIKFSSNLARSNFIALMKEKGIYCPFHYVPLHSSPYGSNVGVFMGDDCVTTKHSEQLVRLPIYFNMNEEELVYVIRSVTELLQDVRTK